MQWDTTNPDWTWEDTLLVQCGAADRIRTELLEAIGGGGEHALEAIGLMFGRYDLD